MLLWTIDCYSIVNSMNVTQRINVNFVSKHSIILRRNFREPLLRSAQPEPLALKVLRVGVRFTFILVVTIGAKKLFLSSFSWTVVTPNSVISVLEVSSLLGACQTFGTTLTFLPQLICIITAFTNQTQIQSIFDYSKRPLKIQNYGAKYDEIKLKGSTE